jgi:hypothetical protein
MDRRDDDRQNGGGGLNARFGDLSVQLIAVGTIALIGTCIRVWAGMDVIQTQIAGLVKSDNRQDTLIEQVRTEMNSMRVQIGILREITRNNAGRP